MKTSRTLGIQKPLSALHWDVPGVWEGCEAGVCISVVSGLGGESGAGGTDPRIAGDCAEKRRGDSNPDVCVRYAGCAERFQKIWGR